MRATLDEVREDWSRLDDPTLELPSGVRILAQEPYVHRDDLPVQFVEESALARATRRFGVVHAFFRALDLWRARDGRSVLLLDGRTLVWMFCALLNRLLAGGRQPILVWGLMVEVHDTWKRRMFGAAMQGVTIAPLWSRAQIEPHARFLGVDARRFMFLPYKANHSRFAPYDLPGADFVFAGGNGKRDYETLARAVEGTGVPVVISATNPRVREAIPDLPNVIRLAATEPAFAQLQAIARFTVVPMQDTGLKGGGEANMCNGMWHGKPVIALDRMAADDYILEGETGHIVAPGDVQTLRARIVELWNDRDRCETMGRRARAHAQAFTHEAFTRRMLRLALVCAAEDTHA